MSSIPFAEITDTDKIWKARELDLTATPKRASSKKDNEVYYINEWRDKRGRLLFYTKRVIKITSEDFKMLTRLNEGSVNW